MMVLSVFVVVLLGIFEYLLWVVEVVVGEWLFVSIDVLYKMMLGVVENGGEVCQFVLINVYLELVGKVVVCGELMVELICEQSGVGFDQCMQEEFDKLLMLNCMYCEKFGFLFIFVVCGYDCYGIIVNFELCVNYLCIEELCMSFDQIYWIVCFCFDDLIDV